MSWFPCRREIALRMLLVGSFFVIQEAPCSEWPAWRYDAQRTAASPDPLPDSLSLQWSRELGKPFPAWPQDQGNLLFDSGDEPIVSDGKVLVPSSRNDSLSAFDAGTGEEVWRFYAQGPVRFAPTAADGKVFFVSDDGFMYALSIATGDLVWKFQGAPEGHLLLGNQRLISMWPARGGPVCEEGVVYFSAGIWPFLGVFVYALDAETGEVRWSNSGQGSSYITQPHSSPAFAGIAPQGYLSLSGDRLLVAGGRTVPAGFDKKTGELAYYEANHGKQTGGYAVLAGRDWFLNYDILFDLEKGDLIERGLNRGDLPVIAGNTAYSLVENQMVARTIEIRDVTQTNRRGKTETVRDAWAEEQWRASLPFPLSQVHLLAGDRLYVSGPEGKLAAVSVAEDDRRGKVVWEGKVEGPVWNMVAADHRLFVITTDGKLYAFGAEQNQGKTYAHPSPSAETSQAARAEAAGILEKTGVREGYGLVVGLEQGDLTLELLRQSNLHWVVLDPDPARIERFRNRMVAEGLYGERVAALVADPATTRLPQYMASLIVSESLFGPPETKANTFSEAAGENLQPLLKTLFNSLRPYGGIACLKGENSENFWQGIEASIVQANLENPESRIEGEWLLLERPGALPGSADWTHQYGNPSNTVVSKDSRIRTPLGLLWFGGPSNQGILPRHGHGPVEQVIDGRLIIEGPDMLRAVDVYTGRLLWESALPGVGAVYDNTAHQPGANAVGSNYVSTSDGIYVAYGKVGLRLDPATGKVLREFPIPDAHNAGENATWGFLNLQGDVLVVGISPVEFDSDVYFFPEEFRKLEDQDWEAMAAWVNRAAGKDLSPRKDEEIVETLNEMLNSATLVDHLPENPGAMERTAEIRAKIHEHLSARNSDIQTDTVLMKLNREMMVPFVPNIRARTIKVGDWVYSGVSSKSLVALDRNTGEILWTRQARNAFVHNTIILGNGKVFAIDRLPTSEIEHLKRRGQTPEATFEILALDARSGEEVWSHRENVFGTWLGYSEEHDVLLEAGRFSRDMLPDPNDRLATFRGSDGTPMWRKEIEYGGPCMLHGDTLITQGFALDLLTGEPKNRKHPLTGVEEPWTFERNYGCNSAIGSEHLLTFRSAAAGFFDLANDGGTGNLGGFRSGCTTNLVVANGVLNAPDYTRTCICAYQLQTSVALVTMPEMEMWTFNNLDKPKDPVKQVGLNLGAPGDRRADDGTLWLDFPSEGGPSPDFAVKTGGAKPRYYRKNALEIQQGGQGWNWVACSGAEGLEEITVTLAENWPSQRKYTVRLHFAEVDSVHPGDRVIDVEIQGQKVLENFDIAQETGIAKSIVKEFSGIEVTNNLAIRLSKASVGELEPILSGIEIQAEGW